MSKTLLQHHVARLIQQYFSFEENDKYDFDDCGEYVNEVMNEKYKKLIEVCNDEKTEILNGFHPYLRYGKFYINGDDVFNIIYCCDKFKYLKDKLDEE